jgi:OmpA-OmpF porin, OOP family
MDILQTIRISISPAQIAAVANSIGASPQATQLAINGAIPAILGGIVHRGGTTHGAVGLIHMMKSLPIVGRLGDLFGGRDDRLRSTGSSLLSQLFGTQLTTIVNRIANFAGMESRSAEGLMAMTAPVVLGGVARAAPPGGFTPDSLVGELESQKTSIADALPAGLSGLTTAIGGSGWGGTVSRTDDRNLMWVTWALGASALVLAVVLFFEISG